MAEMLAAIGGTVAAVGTTPMAAAVGRQYQKQRMKTTLNNKVAVITTAVAIVLVWHW
jgi:hypothetical protein